MSRKWLHQKTVGTMPSHGEDIPTPDIRDEQEYREYCDKVFRFIRKHGSVTYRELAKANFDAYRVQLAIDTLEIARRVARRSNGWAEIIVAIREDSK